jgi:hypothetical protein
VAALTALQAGLFAAAETQQEAKAGDQEET